MKKHDDVNGLVLAGGKSARMGFDKGLIEYHGIPHRLYLYQLLEKICTKTYMGLRTDQQQEEDGLPLVLDNDAYPGPFRSILSAHDAHPEKAWLVVACDLPFLTEASLLQLVAERDPSKAATAFFNRSSGFLEPLIALWEPQSLELAQTYVAEGGKCPRKFLMSLDIKQLQAHNEQELANANFPADYELARKALHK